MKHTKNTETDIIESVKLWWFMLTVRFMMWRLDRRRDFNSWLHCKRGYHRIVPDGLKVSRSQGGGKPMRCVLNVGWHRCLNCQTKFFLRKKDKERYLSHEEREKEMFKKAFERFHRRGPK